MRLSALLGVVFVAAVQRSVLAQAPVELIAGDPAASAELAKIIEAAQQNGLPTEPIVAKIQYAVRVAHAPTPLIVSAARLTAARLEEARKALAPQPTPRDIAAGEDALRAKVSPQSLQEVRRVAANRPLAVPLGVLAQLVQNGVAEKRAAKIVTDLIKRGASAEQIVALGNDVLDDVRVGTAINNALELRMNRLNAVLGLPSANGDAAALSATSGDGRKKP